MPLRVDAFGELLRDGARFHRNDESTDKGAAIAQRIGIRLLRWRGEWVYDTTVGVDWPALMAKGVDGRIISGALRREILLVPGVRKIRKLSLSLDASTRTLSVSGEVETEAGSVDFTALVGGV